MRQHRHESVCWPHQEKRCLYGVPNRTTEINNMKLNIKNMLVSFICLLSGQRPEFWPGTPARFNYCIKHDLLGSATLRASNKNTFNVI